MFYLVASVPRRFFVNGKLYYWRNTFWDILMSLPFLYLQCLDLSFKLVHVYYRSGVRKRMFFSEYSTLWDFYPYRICEWRLQNDGRVTLKVYFSVIGHVSCYTGDRYVRLKCLLLSYWYSIIYPLKCASFACLAFCIHWSPL